MAADVVVVSNALCVLINKFGKCAMKPLKSLVRDFYDVGALCDAKRQLMNDIKGMNLDIDVPHVPERRESDNKADRIVDDIFTLITFLDENLKLTLLPRYVSDNPDLIPSTRLYEGDLQVFLHSLERIEKEIKELNMAILMEVRSTKDLLIARSAGNTGSLPQSSCVLPELG